MLNPFLPVTKFSIYEGQKELQFSRHTWGEIEKPIWLSKCVYRDSSASVERSGILMLTRGAIYIFRVKTVSGISLRQHHHLLKFTKIEQTTGRVYLTYIKEIKINQKKKAKQPETPKDDTEALLLDNTNLFEQEKKLEKQKETSMLALEFPHTEEFCVTLRSLILNILYQVPETVFPVPQFSFERSDIQLMEPLVRPKFSLTRRAIFTAHRELSWGKHLSIAKYFTVKWDGGSVLKIGSSFQTLYYAKAFGDAVGWETAINTVCFKHASFDGFDTFLNAILKTSLTITKIVFTNYPPDLPLNFSFVPELTRVSTWHFINCAANSVISFLKSSKNMYQPPGEIAISRRAYSEKDITSIIKEFKESPIAFRVETLQLVDLRFRRFPFDLLSSFIASMPLLNTIVLRNIEVDGNHLFYSLTKEKPVIRQLKLQKLTFKEQLPDDFKLPLGLIVLDISESEFIGNSFTSFLLSICGRSATNKFILNASNLKITEYEFQLLKQTMDLIEANHESGLIQSNIMEINLSDCFLPSLGVKQMFKFLRTQTELRQLTINDINCDDPKEFTISMCDLMLYLNDLKGVDFTQRLGEDFTIQILARFSAANLERICIKNCNAGNEGIKKLLELVQTNRFLKEFSFDGCGPKPLENGEKHPLFDLWETIARKRSIVANDFPYKDIKALGYTLDNVPNKHTGWVEKLLARPHPKTQDQRIEEELKNVIQEERKAAEEHNE